MNEIKVYPSGKKAAQENKQPQAMNLKMKTHACGQNQDELQNPFSNKILAGAAIIGAGAAYVGNYINEVSVGIGNQAFAERDEVGYAAGYAGAIGGAVIGGGGLFVCATSAAVLANRARKAYNNSAAAQKINPAMRKVGAFLSKNAQRAADYVRLTENDTMHKGEYFRTVVPAKDGKMGHTYVNPLKKFMNNFRNNGSR